VKQKFMSRPPRQDCDVFSPLMKIEFTQVKV
jgi:hypothetical protein